MMEASARICVHFFSDSTMPPDAQRLQEFLHQLCGTEHPLFSVENRHALETVLLDFFMQSVRSRALFKRLCRQRL